MVGSMQGDPGLLGPKGRAGRPGEQVRQCDLKDAPLELHEVFAADFLEPGLSLGCEPLNTTFVLLAFFSAIRRERGRRGAYLEVSYWEIGRHSSDGFTLLPSL